MKTAVIISGGSLNPDFALAFLRKEEPEILIGADRGICFLRDKGIRLTHIVGDFDSASGDALEYFRRFPEIPIRKFNPVKDLTDTEIAMNLAIELGAERIFILGGTGTDWIMWWQISSFWPWPSSRERNVFSSMSTTGSASRISR